MQNTMVDDIGGVLNYIPCDDYNTWVKVGMALKHEGYPCSLWDDWSRGSNKYKAGNCEKKWTTFNEATADIVTGGTIIKWATDNGYRPPVYNETLDLHNLVLKPIIDPSFVDHEKMPAPTIKWDGKAELIEYLETLFSPDEYVGYCTNLVKRNDGGYYPTKGIYGRTARQIIDALKKSPINEALGTVGEGGAYIRFNPLDGQGEGNRNVTRRDYCLIESDTDSIDKQYSLLKAMNLPIAFIINSGGKSLHAIVHVDAVNEQQYRDRVNIIYDFCEKNGLTPDKQDKNESRYSRMPGVMRGKNKQYIVERNIGAKDFFEWQKWVEEQNDDLPETESLADVWDDMQPLAEELIEGVLRVGHKLLIAGPSKAGKTFLLMNLAVSFAEGIPWLGMNCKQGKALYINLELDKVSCEHRFKEIYKKLGITPDNLQSIIVWNLRGKAAPIEKLAPSIIHRFKDKGLEAIIIDPIYKILGNADENNAGDMTKFCNQFDRIALECNCSVIYCHHHSKGASGKYQNAADRSSGSGVFARDPDAILDLSEITSKENFKLAAKKYVKQNPEATEENLTGWELSGTLREFPSFKPKKIWFDYPLHRLDEWNFLADCKTGSDNNDNGVGKNQHSQAEWLNKTDDILKITESIGNNCISVNDLGMSYSNARRKFGPSSEYKVVKLTEDLYIVTRRNTEEPFIYNGTRYIKNPNVMKKGYIIEETN